MNEKWMTEMIKHKLDRLDSLADQLPHDLKLKANEMKEAVFTSIYEVIREHNIQRNDNKVSAQENKIRKNNVNSIKID